jgi:cobalt/nickel transport system ATP-binding protein
MEPDILVLDEPTTFLDPPAQRVLADLLRGLPQAKIVVTHNTPFAQTVCDRAVFFERGKIAARGSVEEIVAHFDWNFASQATNFER